MDNCTVFVYPLPCFGFVFGIDYFIKKKKEY
jgi:hypothetical protein